MRVLRINIQLRQTVIGKAMMLLRIPVILGMMGLIDFDNAKIMILKTYRYRTGQGKWKKIGQEYKISWERKA